MTFRLIATTENRIREVVQFAINVATGRSRAVGTVTLRANRATTVVEAPWLAEGDTIMLMPMTANAAAALPTTWIDAPAQGSSLTKASFTIHHANAATTDRRFRWHSAGG